MKKSGYRLSARLYLIVCVFILVAAFMMFGLFHIMITVVTPTGKYVRSDWAQNFAKSFKEQIDFTDVKPQITQNGLMELQENHIGLQIIDEEGNEVYAFLKQEGIKDKYSAQDLYELTKNNYAGNDSITSIAEENNTYIYILHIPLKIKKTTMYFNATYFKNGKTVFGIIIFILSIMIMIVVLMYGWWASKAIHCLTTSIEDISKRTYLPVKKRGVFQDIYQSLNAMDYDIQESDEQRKQTETMRKEWIANITHDLKTPLSPIKGYAELMFEGREFDKEKYQKYAGIMMKNAYFMQNMIEDLKLTYQLDNGMIPMETKNCNIVIFMRELVVDILNRPEYEEREIAFDTDAEDISFCFDEKLLRRAFQNLIINAFVHGDKETKILIEIKSIDNKIQINIIDNGKGMEKAETECLFERYYRGTNTEKKTEGTGLGLAIAKNIIEVHQGTITVQSEIGKGTTFLITFPKN